MSLLKSIAGAALPFVGPTALAMGESALAYKGQQDTNEQNLAIAREQMDFQERMVDQAQEFEKDMSSSAYQRAMTDMKAAGLNPMLAYQQGGASTPIGKTAPGASAQMQNPFAGMNASPSAVMSTSSDIMTQAQNRENLKSKLENDIAYRELTWAQRQKVYTEAEKIYEEIALATANADAVEADNVQRQIMADFLNSNQFAGIAKGLGISPSTLGAIFRGVFGNSPLIKR